MGKKNGSYAQAIQRRAAKLVNTDGAMHCKSPKKWEVASHSSPTGWRIVRVTEEGLICDCPYSQKRNAVCTHSKAVEMMILQKTFQMTPGTKKVVLAEGVELLCPNGHADLKKDGTRDRAPRTRAALQMPHMRQTPNRWQRRF